MKGSDHLAGDDPDLGAGSLRVAREERPGPVHLELPEDIAVGGGR
jgi:thiamine pyrophosphate-dependent acetolactate synthase large subunit-like protein